MKRYSGALCRLLLCLILQMAVIVLAACAVAEMPSMTVYETRLYRVDREPVEVVLWTAGTETNVPLVDSGILDILYPEKGFSYENRRLFCETDEGVFEFDLDRNIIIQNGFNVTRPLSEGDAPTVRGTGISMEGGEAVVFDLGAYGYRCYEAGEGILIPVPVLSALVVEAYNDTLFTDGRNLYYVTIHELATEEYKKKYDRQLLPLLKQGPWAEERNSRDLATANYNALCFRMDYVYGYHRERWPEGFDAYLRANWPQVRLEMLSGDPLDVLQAVNEIVLYCVNDIHTTTGDLAPWFSKYSARRQAELLPSDGNLGPSRVLDREERFNEYTKLRAARISGAKASRRYEGLRFYKDMAVITWDEFTMDMDWWKAYKTGDAVTARDTLGFLYRSFEKIEKHPEVKKVVLDLTCNYGGITDGGLLAMGFMKREFFCELHSGLTGTVRKEFYRVDTNLDGVVDDRDSYEGQYDFYILISDASFSCGNLLPAIAKEQGAATILGLRSAGGGCSIYIMKDLYGTTIGYSGTWAGYTHSAAGMLLSNDDGVQPDRIAESDIWYNDAKLWALISADEQEQAP